MKLKRNLILFLLVVTFGKLASGQTPYEYILNTTIGVKDGPGKPILKNPFVGGLLLPQFSAIDFNLDGFNDLLIFDRATKKFYTFLNDAIPNTASYTYDPEYEMALPACTNFCLSYDYNNDGKMDLFIESNGFIKQYRNNSTITAFSVAAPDTLWDCTQINIYCPSTNIPSFNDIDNDGDMDILTWDPTGFTIQLYKNFRNEKGMTNDQWEFGLTDECWGKFYLTYSLNLAYKCGFVYPKTGHYDHPCDPTPGGSAQNFQARNTKVNTWTPAPFNPNGNKRILPVHSGSTLLTLDIDSDGDYEALLGDIYYNYLYFLKNGKKELNWVRDTMIDKDSLYPSIPERMQVDYFPAAYFIDIDNDGKRDIILAPNDGSGASKSHDQIYFYKNTGTDRKPVFSLVQRNFLQQTMTDFGSGAAPAYCDIDGDGDKDLFIATQGEFTRTLNSKDVILYFKNTGSDMSPIYELQDTNFLNLYSKTMSGIRMTFGDLNGDGKSDMLIGESNGLLKYYINTSVGGTPSFVENTTQFATFQDRNYNAPFLVDYDRDGKLDMFTGNYDGSISYYRNTGTVNVPVFSKVMDSVGKVNTSELSIDYSTGKRSFYVPGFSTPVIADLNNDGKYDLLVGGKYGLYLFKNFEGKLTDSLSASDYFLKMKTYQSASSKPTGLYATPAVAQMDSDNLLDIIVGNCGGGFSIFTTNGHGSVGIRKNEVSHTLKIVPNPANSHVEIYGTGNEKYDVTIYDLTGKQIQVSIDIRGHEAINISGLDRGAYILTAITKDGTMYSSRFVKM